MSESINEPVVNAVHRIANSLQKNRGYATSISLCQTRTVLESYVLLIAELAKHSSKEDAKDESE